MLKILGGTLLLAGAVFLGSGSAWAASCDGTDMNGDGATTEADFEILKAYFGSDDGAEGFEPAADLNGDGAVDFADVSILQSCL